VSGLSAGLMTGTATATLTELVPASASRRASLVATAANMGGLGLGPLIAGLFAQYAPHPERRGQAISTYFMACYSGLIIPVVGVGVASGFIGDFAAVLAFSILIAALCLFCLASIWRALLPPGGRQAPGGNDAFRHSIENGSHSGGGEAAYPPGLETRVSTPRSR
jgi:MFS family permease